LYPTPCSDRGVKSPSKSHKISENLSPTSPASSCSLSSVSSRDTVAEAKDSVSTAHSRQDILEFEGETDAEYKHRLHLVRTCSIRHTVQKTFLEPICDDCLLLELGLAPQVGSTEGEHGGEGLNGAEWLLESSVEITVVPPAGDAAAFQRRSKQCSSSDDESEDETLGRGRGRRRALEINRDSLVRDESSLSKSCSSFQRFKQAGQHLRRARKQQDLKSPSASCTSFLESSSAESSTTSSSWIDHLKISDLGQRGRKKRPGVMSETKSTDRIEEVTQASSATLGEGEDKDRNLSLPSIPATASSNFSSTLVSHEDSIILPLNQVISSSEFESSQLSDQGTHLQSEQQAFHPDRNPDLEGARRKSSSSCSRKSFHTAAGVASRAPSPNKGRSAGFEGAEVIAMHPLSSPLPVSTFREESTHRGESQEESRESSLN
jgi:hypothetical protein